MRDDASMGTIEKLPEWRLRRHGREAELELTGDWIACETGVRSPAEVRRIIDDTGDMTLRIDTAGIGRWDSALIAFVRMIRDTVRPGRTKRAGSIPLACGKRPGVCSLSQRPTGARRRGPKRHHDLWRHG